ncbi:glycosyl hydrolase [Paraburkholderia phenoliruptrix]|nr:glycosyl hydrolase [Paraburkholderia phenoliruptrix]MBW0447454.1 glycosyl hydrolase [Paraburkholderia phenoliruptrix]MBW9098343.1 glycosyl hydrolase [Paraburkholderia phenoliruptrix]
MTTPGWQTLSTTFMKNDKPYGGGDARINGNDVISLKIADPVITFKPAEELKDPRVAEPTEAWMNNTAETLNRNTVAFFRGTVDGGLTRYFQQPGQDAAWWYSKDWSTQYVSTDWMDYKRADHETGPAPHITKLWRSRDGGRNWTQLDWPENRYIGQLFFLDPERGYAIGWGPSVWRTADGGRTWKAIPVPPGATDRAEPRKTFDAVDLGPDGILRVAYYVPEEIEEIQPESLVDRLKWDSEAFEPDVKLPDQVVVSLRSEPVPPDYSYAVYALSRLGKPANIIEDPNDNGRRTGALSTWGNCGTQTVEQLHTFDARLMLEGISVGRRGVLLVYATDASGEGAPRDITLASKDYGKSWSETDDGITQGVYFDAATNTQYGLYAYTLKKRTW